MFTKKWIADVAERVAATFVMAFAGSWILAGADLFHLSSLRAAAAAGVAAGLSLLKGALASLFGQPGSASLVPALEPSPGPALKPSTRVHSSPAPKRSPRKPRAPGK